MQSKREYSKLVGMWKNTLGGSEEAGTCWRTSLLIAIILWHDRLGQKSCSGSIEENFNYHTMIIKTSNLEGIWDIRMILGSKELKELLPLLPHGPEFGEALRIQKQFILDNWIQDENVRYKSLLEPLRTHLKNYFRRYA